MDVADRQQALGKQLRARNLCQRRSFSSFMNTITQLVGAAAIAALLAASPAVAQGSNKNDSSIFIVTVGPGLVLRPEFPGAKDMKLRFWPLIDVRKVGTDPTFSTPDQSFGPGLIRSEGFRAGPALRLGESRDEDDAIDGIGDVRRAIEVGAFAEAYLSPGLRARGEVRKGFGGHKGLLADLGADVIVGKVTDPLQFSIGPRARLADKKYVRAFYGIDAAQALGTGLPLHDPDGGLHSVGALGSMEYRMSGGFGLQAFARYDRLLGDAADSPLVRSSVGSRNQFEVGAGVTYSFGI
jgi:outer membrane protein